MQTLTPLELKEIFPEAGPIIKRNLAIWKKYFSVTRELYEELLDAGMVEIYRNGGSDIEVNKWIGLIYGDTGRIVEGVPVLWALTGHLKPKGIQWHVQRLMRLSELYRNTDENSEVRKTEITDADIEKAKSVWIGSFVEINNSGFFICPFHDDRHPSMKYYLEKNNAYCFACAKSADSIDIVMQHKGLGFVEAVKFLIR